MKSIITIFTVLIVFSSGVLAQDSTSNNHTYQSAIALKFGPLISGAYSKFFNENNAVEISAGYRSADNKHWDKSFFHFNAAYYLYQNIWFSKGLYAYVGIGATTFIYDDNSVVSSDASFGTSGYLGLEYRFKNIPIALSVDGTSRYMFNGFYEGFKAGFGTVSIKYTFEK